MAVLHNVCLILAAFAVGSWWGKRLAKWTMPALRRKAQAARRLRRELETRSIVRDELHKIIDAKDDVQAKDAGRLDVN